MRKALLLEPDNPNILLKAADFWIEQKTEHLEKPVDSETRYDVYCVLITGTAALIISCGLFLLFALIASAVFLMKRVLKARKRKKEQRNIWLYAEQLYRESLQIKPNDSQTLNNLGCALLKLQKEKQAMLAFRSALLLDPTCEASQNNTHLSVTKWIGQKGFLGCFGFVALNMASYKFILAVYLTIRIPELLGVFIVLCTTLVVWYWLRRIYRIRKIQQEDPQLMEIFKRLEEDHAAGRWNNET